MRFSVVMAALAILTLVVGAGGVEAVSSYGGTSVWTMVGAPAVKTIVAEGVFVTYENNLNVPTQGLIVMIVRNSMGQTLAFGTATVSMNATSSSVAFIIAEGITAGTYSISIFAETFGGVAISDSTVSSLVYT